MPLHVSSIICLSSGGKNCIIQHLVSSHSVGGRPVHRLREESLNLCTGRHVDAYNKLIIKEQFVQQVV